MRHVTWMQGRPQAAPLQNAEVGEHLARGTELAQAAIGAVDHGAAFDQVDLAPGPQPAGREY